jgi:hypothetical protein
MPKEIEGIGRRGEWVLEIEKIAGVVLPINPSA